MRPVCSVLLLCASLLAGCRAGRAPTHPALPAGAEPAWVRASNRHAELLGGTLARFRPEMAGALGIEGFDSEVLDLGPGCGQRLRDALLAVQRQLEARRAALRDADAQVRQDLTILIDAAARERRQSELEESLLVFYFDLHGTVFGGLRVLLDAQVAPARRAAALVRLRRYAGLEPGYRPIAGLAIERLRETLGRPGLVPPSRAEVEKHLSTAQYFVDGIAELFRTHRIAGYEAAHARLVEQLHGYTDVVRRELLPRARGDFRLPPALYQHHLEEHGVEMPAEELAAAARAAFTQLQQEMQALAGELAQRRGLPGRDYREVIRALKREQLIGAEILPHYQERLGQIERIIAREQLVTLPRRAARIRLASAAESAAVPAPNMRPPRLIGNTGEQGEFVLPLNVPAPPGAGAKETQRLDDFTHRAASWALTAHEARPGHEMQFAALVEQGVSVARAVYAFNASNVEGWGLYAEHLVFPHLPPEGQLIALQMQLLRAARAFLDPELQLGKISPARALELLTRDVVLSPAMATQEIERYTFRAPGQATAYFYGLRQLLALRADVEKALGARFVQRAFHDFLLRQGLLPPALLRQAVEQQFLAGAGAVSAAGSASARR
jgi:hypothetical protein